ncbi:hypothetical protein DCMF_25200 [Candidatus Formimonas warabiya]|uniref:DUF1468 domain-containing protein n=1 Tax=Formimonas warabiya TaxID=1761012 RepID=A0A3G1KZ02_FORW1|nr:hypothetical protein DCMF_25200 [Candidatus Formimonas warabiya]
MGSVYVIWQSVQMDYMVDKVPGPGFVPFWCGFFTGVLSALLLFTSIFSREKSSEKNLFDKKIYKNMASVIGASALAMFLVNYLGMLVCIGLLTGFLSWAFGNKNLSTCVMITVFTPLGFWLLFEKALEITLPHGLLGF